MKYFLIVYIFFASTNFCLAQKKKDNTVIIHGFVSYSKLKEALFKEGFVPVNSDSSFIMTSSKAVGWVGEVSYLIQHTDTSVIFKGSVLAEVNGMSTGKMPLENVGSKESVYREGFKLMSKIASSFGLPISFLRQE
jgi:hypothetical protein